MVFDGDGTRQQDTVTLLQYRDEQSNGKITRVIFGSIDTTSNYSLQYIDSEDIETVFPGKMNPVLLY